MTIACIGECMVELAPQPGGLFRRGFAGDTLNTAWYLKSLTGQALRYVTAVGADALSQAMVDFIAGHGIDTSHIARLPGATVGLYMITLNNTERSFTYWRGQSAARHLASDRAHLEAALDGVHLAYLSGITLAILPENDRAQLLDTLAQFRMRGGQIAFDPNIRPQLWPDRHAMDRAFAAIYALTDIALPSFDDEARAYGDGTPADTARRLTALGAAEVVVKNAAAPALVWSAGGISQAAPPAVADARDTTGAGDAFNAGYLAARLAGHAPALALARAHALAGEVIRHPGALIPPAALSRFLKGPP